jgi:hypothetical protein
MASTNDRSGWNGRVLATHPGAGVVMKPLGLGGTSGNLPMLQRI